MYEDPIYPDRIPTPIVFLFSVAFVLLTLAAIGAVVLAVMNLYGAGYPLGLGTDFSIPGNRIGQVAWFQAAIGLLAMFLVWLFSILIVSAQLVERYRNAAANAVVLVRMTIAIILIRFLAVASIPYLLSDSIWATMMQLATGLPLIVAEVALLIAADFYFSTIRQNAAR